MECAIITTYRRNAKCGMCHTWKNPSKASEEFDPKILETIPGGEQMLRMDFREIVRILDQKSKRE